MRTSVLLSYFFWQRHELAAVLDGFPERPTVFADSGGFSASSVGATIDLDEYAKWLDANRESIDVACTLDVVGDAPATLENTRRLEAHGHRVLPVFHVGEPFEFMHRYCEEYPYVGVGGMVPYSSRQRSVLKWLVECFAIAAEHGTVIHGLGQTTARTLAVLPFYSVDSSSWVSAERYGEFYVWDDQHAVLRTLHPLRDRDEMLRLGRLVREHGLDPSLLKVPVRSTKDPTKVHSPTSAGELVPIARAASLRAWLRYGDWWANRHGTVALDGMPDGPLMFFVCLDTRQVATVKQVALEQTGVTDGAAATA